MERKINAFCTSLNCDWARLDTVGMDVKRICFSALSHVRDLPEHEVKIRSVELS